MLGKARSRRKIH